MKHDRPNKPNIPWQDKHGSWWLARLEAGRIVLLGFGAYGHKIEHYADNLPDRFIGDWTPGIPAQTVAQCAVDLFSEEIDGLSEVEKADMVEAILRRVFQTGEKS